MTDLLDAVQPTVSDDTPTAETAAPVRRRRIAKPKAAPVEQVELPAAGGFVGLWRALNGKPEGASARGDAGLTFAFVVCILFGTGLCFVGAFEIPFGRQIGFAGPLLATLAYPVWGAMIGAATRPSLRERLADNSYYLGFIFTQIALLVGFLPAAFGSAELSADQIIRFFGVALGASLIGLVARTILIQMSYTVDEAADVVSGEVSALARQVSERSSEVLSHFDALVERLAESQAKLTTELQSGMIALTNTVAAYETTMRSDAAELHQGVAAASTAAERTSAQFGQHQQRLADSISAVASVIERLKASLEHQVQDATQSINETTAAVQRGLGSLQEVDALRDGVAAVDQRVSALGERLSVVDGRVATVGDAVNQSMTRLDAEVDRVTQANLERAAAINANANDAVAALEKTLQGFRTELDRLRA